MFDHLPILVAAYALTVVLAVALASAQLREFGVTRVADSAVEVARAMSTQLEGREP